MPPILSSHPNIAKAIVFFKILAPRPINKTTKINTRRNEITGTHFVAKEFHKLIPNSELHFIDKCGHAPMMEVPDEFNKILGGFITKLKTPAATVH